MQIIDLHCYFTTRISFEADSEFFKLLWEFADDTELDWDHEYLFI
jgi:hypothetical protein